MALTIQMVTFTQFWVVFQLTDSTLMLGMMGLANGVGGAVFYLIGGFCADFWDRRTLLLITAIAYACLSLSLGTMVLVEAIQVYSLLLLAFAMGSVSGLARPVRICLISNLVDRDALIGGLAFNSATWTLGRMFAPASAGLMIVTMGSAVAFYMGLVGSLPLIVILIRMRIPVTAEGPPLGQAIRQGGAQLRILRRTLIGLLLMAVAFSLFGSASYMLPFDVPESGSSADFFKLGAFFAVAALLELALVLTVGILGGKVRWQPRWIPRIGLVLAILLVILPLMSFPLTLAAAFAFPPGALGTVLSPVLFGLALGVTPNAWRGRVVGLYGFSEAIGSGVTSLILGSISALFGTLLAVSGAGIGLGLLSGLGAGILRTSSSEPPFREVVPA